MMNSDAARDYEVRIFWSQADEAFVAHPVEWPSISAVGTTREEAARELGVALDLALEFAREQGVAVPQPRTLAAAIA